MLKQSYFKLYSLALVHSLVVFHPLVWPSKYYHSGLDWSWERWQWKGTPYSTNLHHYWNLTIRLFSFISRTFVGVCLNLRQRKSRCILQPKPIGPQNTHWWVLLLCRDTLCVFYSPSRLGHKALVGVGITPLQRCSWCFLQLLPTGLRDTRVGSHTPLQRSNQCILLP